MRHLANVVRIWPKNRIPTFLLLLLFSKESFSGNSFTLSNNRGRTTINPCNPIFPFLPFPTNEFSRFRIFPGTRVSTRRTRNYFSILRGNTLHPWRMDTLENFKFLPGCCLASWKEKIILFEDRRRGISWNFARERNESRDNGFASVWIMQSARTNRWARRMPRWARLEKRISACCVHLTEVARALGTDFYLPFHHTFLFVPIRGIYQVFQVDDWSSFFSHSSFDEAN